MKKLLAVFLSLSLVLGVSASFETNQKVEKNGGNVKVNTIALDIPASSVEATLNLVTNEVNGLTPALDNAKYQAVSSFVKMSLQDDIGNEMEFMNPVKVTFTELNSLKNPVVLFSSGTSVVEMTGSYVSEVSSYVVDGVKNLNGTFVVAEKLTSDNLMNTTSVTSDTINLDSLMNTAETTDMSGTLMNGSGTDSMEGKGTENLQDRENGSNSYTLMVFLMVLFSFAVLLLKKHKA